MGGIIEIEYDNNITKNQKKRLGFVKTNLSLFFVDRPVRFLNPDRSF
jgi:hypothetical protein